MGNQSGELRGIDMGSSEDSPFGTWTKEDFEDGTRKCLNFLESIPNMLSCDVDNLKRLLGYLRGSNKGLATALKDLIDRIKHLKLEGSFPFILDEALEIIRKS
jgi:hypothetical protein